MTPRAQSLQLQNAVKAALAATAIAEKSAEHMAAIVPIHEAIVASLTKIITQQENIIARLTALANQAAVAPARKGN